MKRPRWISPFVIVAGLGLARAAGAQGANDKAAAEALFDQAKRLMDEKRYPEACPKFADSQRLDPGVGTLLNLARCYKLNGQNASAWSTYREAASQARAARQEDREQHARDEAAALEAGLTRLVIEVAPETAKLQGLVIKRDGTPVPEGLWGVPAPVDPGVRSIDVTAPGKLPVHLEARAEGAGATAKVVIPPLADAPAGDGAASAAVVGVPASPPPNDAGTPPPAASGSQSSGTGQRIAGFVLGGLGAAGIATGTIFGLLSVAENKAADNADTSSGRRRHENNAESARTVAFIALGAGAAALVGGIVLIATAPSGSSREAARLELLPSFGEDQLGLGFRGAF